MTIRQSRDLRPRWADVGTRSPVPRPARAVTSVEFRDVTLIKRGLFNFRLRVTVYTRVLAVLRR